MGQNKKIDKKHTKRIEAIVAGQAKGLFLKEGLKGKPL